MKSRCSNVASLRHRKRHRMESGGRGVGEDAGPGDYGHDGPLLRLLDPLPPAAEPQPRSASSTRKAHSRAARDAGRPPPGEQRDAETRGGILRGYHAPKGSPESGDGGGLSAEGTWSRQREDPGAPWEAWARGQALRGQVSRSRCSPAPAPRHLRLPRAGDAQALPGHAAATPAKDEVAVSPHDLPPAAVLP